jgi:hypothetical protein
MVAAVASDEPRDGAEPAAGDDGRHGQPAPCDVARRTAFEARRARPTIPARAIKVAHQDEQRHHRREQRHEEADEEALDPRLLAAEQAVEQADRDMLVGGGDERQGHEHHGAERETRQLERRGQRRVPHLAAHHIDERDRHQQENDGREREREQAQQRAKDGDVVHCMPRRAATFPLPKGEEGPRQCLRHCLGGEGRRRARGRTGG